VTQKKLNKLIKKAGSSAGDCCGAPGDDFYIYSSKYFKLKKHTLDDVFRKYKTRHPKQSVKLLKF